jgi:hypothetical protein
LNRQPPETNHPVDTLCGNAALRRPLRISGKTVPDGDCELVGIDAGVFYVRLERRIAELSPVTVSFEQTELAGYVTGCQPTEHEWVISIALASGRRREARIPTGEQFTVGIVSNNGTIQCQGTVTDRSSSGMGLRFSRPVAPGTRIYVEMESVMALGEVRHCHATTDGQFIAGVAIAEFLPDARGRNKFTEIFDKVVCKLTAGLRGKGVPAPRSHR